MSLQSANGGVNPLNQLMFSPYQRHPGQTAPSQQHKTAANSGNSTQSDLVSPVVGIPRNNNGRETNAGKNNRYGPALKHTVTQGASNATGQVRNRTQLVSPTNQALAAEHLATSAATTTANSFYKNLNTELGLRNSNNQGGVAQRNDAIQGLPLGLGMYSANGPGTTTAASASLSFSLPGANNNKK